MSSLSDAIPPFYVIPIPFNVNGEGPEMDLLRIVGVAWEVWDQCCMSYATFPTQQEAQIYADELNAKFK